MADIFFSCPRCEQGLVIDEAGVGITVKCPTCDHLLAVPASPPITKETQRMMLFDYPNVTSPANPSDMGKKSD